MKSTKKTWSAEKRRYEKKFIGLAGRTCRVLDIERGQEGEIGYTSSNNQIHLAYDHPIMGGLSDIEKASFREGVFAHEALHQVYTDFAAYERRLAYYKTYERPIFGLFVNVSEDAAIENFAPEVMGGVLLTSLRFSIAHIYKTSPKLEESKTPFSQLVAALINFGDMGLLKGNFTFPESRKVFFQIAPIFAEAVEEPVCKKRIALAEKMMEIAKPLWEQEAKDAEAFAKAMEEMSKRGKSSMRGKGRGKDAEGSEESEESLASKRRKITIKKVSKEELEEMKKNGEIDEGNGNGEIPDGDITAVMCDEEDGNGSGNGMSVPMPSGSGKNNSSESNDSSLEDYDIEIEESEDYKKKKGKKNKTEAEESDAESSQNGSDKKEKGKKEEKSAKSKDGKSSENGQENDANGDSSKPNGKESTNKKDASDNASKGKNSESNNDRNADNADKADTDNSDSKDNPFVCPPNSCDRKIGNVPTPDGFEESEEANRIGEISEEEYSLTAEDVKRIEDELERAVEEYEKEEKAEENTVPIDNFPISSPKLGKRSCLNYRVTYSDSDKEYLEESYAKVIAKLNPGIKALTTQLRRIFENDYEEKEYRSSGKINIQRMNSGRVTARVFDRRVAPAGKSDFCVEILVDESGSMSGRNKDLAARYCCIALSEVFANLNIPCYIIGFTADTQRHDIVHNHYITWKNTHNERLKLLNITARANNCDGYSIRYATEVLKKSRSANKLLIVLSDGQPAAHGYYDGVHDTKQAIRDAKKQNSVLGVAIGNSDTETIHYMYEKDFLSISNVDDLFAGLSRQLQKMMKSWGD